MMRMFAAAAPASVLANELLSDWIAISSERLTIFSGKVELGQGINTAIRQIACDELGVAPDQLELIAGDTARSPDEGYTAGSQSVEVGGASMRWVCAHAFDLFRNAAATNLGAAVSSIFVERGEFGSTSTPNRVSYWELAPFVQLAVVLTETPVGRDIPNEASVGTPLRRDDLGCKLLCAAYIHDFVLPGMVHARMLRGTHPSQRVGEVPVDALRALDGVGEVVHSGNFLALVGPNEARLVRALDKAKKLLTWSQSDELPAQTDTVSLLQAMPHASSVEHSAGAAAVGALQHAATYSRPYLAHASIGPACAIASPGEGTLQVWSHTQGPHMLRNQLALALRMGKDKVVVTHLHGSGCYGHNGADDVAFDAAFIATVIGKPVRVQWMRDEELSMAPFGSASVVSIVGAVDESGRVCDWDLQVWSHTHIARPGWGEGVNLLGAWAIDPPMPRPPSRDMSLPAGGGQRNAVAIYDFPRQHVTYHFIEQSPVRVSAIRSLGAYANTFAIESFVDELSDLAQVDPIAFRLLHLGDSRARGVLERVRDMCGWASRPEPGSGAGLGVAVGRYKNRAAYCAVVVSVAVEEKVRVDRVWAAVDAGAVINPDGLLNQIEGGIIQSLSWSLKEEVKWNAEGIATNHWDTYPILNFDEIPEVEVTLIDRPEMPSLGSGEAAAGPTAAAVGNAVAHALGARCRHLPLTPERISDLIMNA
ncbi:xanthine dehydrogenase family protein molybdopterin-binding subunit [Polaromonas jejuensis]|uniref:Molybdopterin cofactor-binding domain-containing protein n=1 Tax=Polaromonas jejuensis TaxID=457502 RepID=A0ABW0QA51_9BURK|nr:molybdopterin cofactor-binding domain-containing protein [Polaromonas jejuensis]